VGKSFEALAGDGFHILEKREKPYGLEVRLKAAEDMASYNLIRSLVSRYEVIAFEEELPSMEDVFIKVVNPENKMTHE
jgi:ABC-2 type transport system ATP-binding protein